MKNVVTAGNTYEVGLMMKSKLIIIIAMSLFLAGCDRSSQSPAMQEDKTAVTSVENALTESVNDTVPEADNQEALTDDVNNTEEAATTIVELFREHNLMVGTCLAPEMLNRRESEELILNQFNSITMENAMKPDYILNKRKSIETGDIVVEMNPDVIRMLDWAKENHMAVRGHTLIWHSQTPDWIFYEDFDTSKELAGRDVMLSRMDSYIHQVFDFIIDNGYSDVFYAYDIVNEAWNDDGSMRESNWLTTIGEDYLWQAFNYANSYAPAGIDLYYNDYNEQYKSDALIKFVETLVDEDGNYLIDGIGLQAHLYTNDNINTYFNAIEKLSSTGLKVEITELDVSLGAWNNFLPGTDDNLKKQGKYYYEFVNKLFEKVDSGALNMDALTFWGFCDEMSWRKEAYPLLFGENLEPKYAYYGVIQMKEKCGFE